MDNSKEKTCEDCRFYKQHYIKTATGFSFTLYGHCCNKNIDLRNKTKIRENCEYWQPIEIQIAERRKNLISNIRELVKRLDAVCEVLLDDEQN